MRKLIEKGRVQRPSISWLNTLVKWTLTIACDVLVFGPDVIFFAEPLVSLLGIIMPLVQYRLPFTTGVVLVLNHFLFAFMKVVTSWMVKESYSMPLFVRVMMKVM